jgi:hypothetical protein
MNDDSDAGRTVDHLTRWAPKRLALLEKIAETAREVGEGYDSLSGRVPSGPLYRLRQLLLDLNIEEAK